MTYFDGSRTGLKTQLLISATRPPASWRSAAGGQGAVALPPADRPAYRKQVLEFLTAELTAIRNLSTSDWAFAHRTTGHWMEDKDLASVRDAASVSGLPADERDAWNKLWADVRDLRDSTAPKTTAGTMKKK